MNVNQPKTAYASPKLAVYGAFSQLTAAGSQVGTETPAAGMIVNMA
jgi:hypothetical protein